MLTCKVAPNTERDKMNLKKSSSHKVGRDARTGEFTSVKEAQRRPSTTVVETIARDPRKSLAFLKGAGILTPTGRLSVNYKK